ncbi:hypothetical protein ACOMHN_033234 [Nucella lapillus]
MDQGTGACTQGQYAPVTDNVVVVKLELPWSMNEELQEESSAVYSTEQPMSDYTSESLLSLNTSHACQHCSAVFMLSSSLEVHLETFHGKTLHSELPVASRLQNSASDNTNKTPSGQERFSAQMTDRSRDDSVTSATDFVIKLEPVWSMEKEPQDEPSAVYSTVQPMSDNTSGSLLSLNTSHVCQRCSATFVLFSSLELHMVTFHGETSHSFFPVYSAYSYSVGYHHGSETEKLGNYNSQKTVKGRKETVEDNDTDRTDLGKKNRKHTRAGVRGRGGVCNNNDNKGWYEPVNSVGYISDNDIPKFTGVTGMKVPLPTGRTPLGYFSLFVDSGIIKRFVLETNKFAQQVKEHLPTFYYLKMWDCQAGTSEAEMRKMLALLMAMGIVSKPTERMYWSTHPVLETPFFSKVMPRDRFLTLLTFWHLNDNETAPQPGSPQYDKLYKIRPLFDHLQERFSSLYSPEENLAVVESVMPWRSRVARRQFAANKPCRYGMKLYCLCESSSGYILKMKMYTGKEGNKREVDHGPNVVKTLTEQYLNKGHTIFTDSFFTSADLVTHMQDRGTSYVGTALKHQRGNPPDIAGKSVKVAKGKTAVRQKDGVVAVRFNDRKEVMLLSSKFTAEPVNTGKTARLTRQQRHRGEAAQTLVKPKLVHEYNKNMNGVDHFDQHLSYYSFNRKTVKWWKWAATHLLHMAKIQAMILYNKYEEKEKTQADFTLDLIMELINHGEGEPQGEGSATQGSQAQPQPQAGPSREQASDPADEEPPHKKQRCAKPLDFERLSHCDNPHRPVSNPPTEKRLRPPRDCECCTIRGGKRKAYIRRVQSTYMCAACKVPLCLVPCFHIYHSVKDYKREIRRYLDISGNGE